MIGAGVHMLVYTFVDPKNFVIDSRFQTFAVGLLVEFIN